MTDKQKKLLNEIILETERGFQGMDEYAETLEDSYVCTYHFDKIKELVEEILASKEKKEIWVYEIFGDVYGVVKAETKEEAEQKVRNAYKDHYTEFNGFHKIIIKSIYEDSRWFSDHPDVLEVYS